ncbi:hypothetical protein BJY04DRAFT_102678 [Aspergillus karnatakaensis]|uniref:OB-fold domain-containing protein n=1 Tax=Aspergillus karnatakaensis TaxID=1810916 RepID=UPI003CCD1611
MATTNDTTRATTIRSNHGSLQIYPAFCFRASPTNFAWVKMGITDIHRLEKRSEFGDQGLFFYKNHPIRFVSVLGLIISRIDVPRRTIISLDDSTGATIDVVILKKEDSAAAAPAKAPAANNDSQGTKHDKETHQSATTSTPISIAPLIPGKMVQIKGTLSTFRSTIQIQLERFFSVLDTNAEMRFVEARDRLFVEVLSIPWHLDDGEIQKLQIDADEEERGIEVEQVRSRERGRRRAEKEEKDRRRIEKRWDKEEKMRERETEVVREVGKEFMRNLQMKRERAW